MQNVFVPDRIENLEQLEALGERPYLTDAPFIHCSNYEEGVSVSIAGRILTIRRMGKMCFATIMYCPKPN